MLRITQQDSSIGAKAYYSQADYLSEGQELLGRWGGRGARMLGLEGTVGKEAFDRLCDNLHPQTGEQLTARTRSGRRVGYDFTWSVPKSVSVLYAMTEDKQLLDAFRSAVDETMQDIEAEMKCRVRKGGKDENRTTGNMVWAEFIHTTSRPVGGVPDPQLHAHCFAFNSTWDMKEQQWKAGQFGDLKRDGPYFQSVMRVRLANKLQELGLSIVRKRDDFEIAGVPASVISKFSRRTAEIEEAHVGILARQLKKLGCGIINDNGQLVIGGVEQSAQQVIAEAEKLGLVNPGLKAELGEKTREHKNHNLSWNELRAAWGDRLTNAEQQAVIAANRRVGSSRCQTGQEKLAVDHALGHCFERESVVSERKLLTEALKRGLGAVTVDGVKKELASRPLIRGEHAGQTAATTPDLKAAEERLLAFARGVRGCLRPLISQDYVCVRDWLNAGQQAAVRHVLASRDAVTLIRGPAGSGKTELEGELRMGLHEAGAPVVAVAQSTTAVDELRERAGFSAAATISHFMRDKRMQASIAGGLLLVDEASLIGTRDMAKLFAIVAEQDARIVLVGDVRQHRSVSAGEPMRLLSERGGLHVAEVTEIVRQLHGDYRKAARALADGKTVQGFAELDKLGWIREIDHAGRYWLMAQGYLSTILEKKKNGKPKEALCVSPTHAEGARVTAFIRNALKQDGKLKEKEERTLPVWIPAHLTDPEKADRTQYEPGVMLQFHDAAPRHKKGSRLVVGEDAAVPVGYAGRFSVFRPAQLAVAVNDRIRITHNGKTSDGKHALKNGVLLTVQGFTKQGDLIVDHGWVIGKDFGHIAHGYCVTSHNAEGRTVDKVFIAQSSDSFGATNQRSFYVPATRGREQAVIFTDSKQELLRAAKRADQPLSAVEFAEQAKKPTLRQRLMKHLDDLRRLGTFEQTHARAAADRQQELLFQQEWNYGR